MSNPIRVAVLDDYQHVALAYADWTVLKDQVSVTVFHDHLLDEAALAARLKPFEVICVMRERTPLTRQLLEQLPQLKLVVSTGFRNASIDMQAAADLGITVKPTGYHTSGAPEHTWALLMALAKNIVPDSREVRKGGWQTAVSSDLKGKTIGIVGLGNIGATIAKYARMFDMEVIAWSENLTAEKATAQGARLVSKEQLFRESDFITIHLVLSQRSRGIISGADLALMKPAAYLVNTSRGPLVNEADLVQALQNRAFAGAALDVFETEPLPGDHPFRTLDNVLATPHTGYVTGDTYRIFFTDTVKAIADWVGEQHE